MQAPTPVETCQYDALPVAIYDSNAAMGHAAALAARAIIQAAHAERGHANIILATGNSQLTFLHALRDLDGIDWSRVTVFHMDEYIGIDPDHPASFPLFLRQHIIDQVNPGQFCPIPSQPHDVEDACRNYEALLRDYPADLVAMGWGENGHIAFNDPPYAKFDDIVWVKVVALAETSRRQQVGEGHFATLHDVPSRHHLNRPRAAGAQNILCIVPEARKAEAVRACLTEPVSEDRPGSILRTVHHAQLYLDQESAARL
ncbi:MAG: 6-phosphogluconolactonase [Caldilineaceae bacterium]